MKYQKKKNSDKPKRKRGRPRLSHNIAVQTDLDLSQTNFTSSCEESGSTRQMKMTCQPADDTESSTVTSTSVDVRTPPSSDGKEQTKDFNVKVPSPDLQDHVSSSVVPSLEPNSEKISIESHTEIELASSSLPLTDPGCPPSSSRLVIPPLRKTKPRFLLRNPVRPVPLGQIQLLGQSTIRPRLIGQNNLQHRQFFKAPVLESNTFQAEMCKDRPSAHRCQPERDPVKKNDEGTFGNLQKQGNPAVHSPKSTMDLDDILNEITQGQEQPMTKKIKKRGRLHGNVSRDKARCRTLRSYAKESIGDEDKDPTLGPSSRKISKDQGSKETESDKDKGNKQSSQKALENARNKESETRKDKNHVLSEDKRNPSSTENKMGEANSTCGDIRSVDKGQVNCSQGPDIKVVTTSNRKSLHKREKDTSPQKNSGMKIYRMKKKDEKEVEKTKQKDVGKEIGRIKKQVGKQSLGVNQADKGTGQNSIVIVKMNVRDITVAEKQSESVEKQTAPKKGKVDGLATVTKNKNNKVTSTKLDKTSRIPSKDGGPSKMEARPDRDLEARDCEPQSQTSTKCAVPTTQICNVYSAWSKIDGKSKEAISGKIIHTSTKVKRKSLASNDMSVKKRLRFDKTVEDCERKEGKENPEVQSVRTGDTSTEHDLDRVLTPQAAKGSKHKAKSNATTVDIAKGSRCKAKSDVITVDIAKGSRHKAKSDATSVDIAKGSRHTAKSDATSVDKAKGSRHTAKSDATSVDKAKGSRHTAKSDATSVDKAKESRHKAKSSVTTVDIAKGSRRKAKSDATTVHTAKGSRHTAKSDVTTGDTAKGSRHSAKSDATTVDPAKGSRHTAKSDATTGGKHNPKTLKGPVEDVTKKQILSGNPRNVVNEGNREELCEHDGESEVDRIDLSGKQAEGPSSSVIPDCADCKQQYIQTGTCDDSQVNVQTNATSSCSTKTNLLKHGGVRRKKKTTASVWCARRRRKRNVLGTITRQMFPHLDRKTLIRVQKLQNLLTNNLPCRKMSGHGGDIKDVTEDSSSSSREVTGIAGSLRNQDRSKGNNQPVKMKQKSSCSTKEFTDNDGVTELQNLSNVFQEADVAQNTSDPSDQLIRKFTMEPYTQTIDNNFSHENVERTTLEKVVETNFKPVQTEIGGGIGLMEAGSQNERPSNDDCHSVNNFEGQCSEVSDCVDQCTKHFYHRQKQVADGQAIEVSDDCQSREVSDCQPVSDGCDSEGISDGQYMKISDDGQSVEVSDDCPSREVSDCQPVSDGCDSEGIYDDQYMKISDDGQSVEVSDDAQSTELSDAQSLEDSDYDQSVENSDVQIIEVSNDGQSMEVSDDGQSTEVYGDGHSMEVSSELVEVSDDGQSTVVSYDDQSTKVSYEGQSLEVSGDGHSMEVPSELVEVSDDGQSTEVCDDGCSMKVSDDGQSTEVCDDGCSMKVSDDGQSTEVCDDGCSMKVSDDSKTEEISDGGQTVDISVVQVMATDESGWHVKIIHHPCNNEESKSGESCQSGSSTATDGKAVMINSVVKVDGKEDKNRSKKDLSDGQVSDKGRLRYTRSAKTSALTAIEKLGVHSRSVKVNGESSHNVTELPTCQNDSFSFKKHILETSPQSNNSDIGLHLEAVSPVSENFHQSSSPISSDHGNQGSVKSAVNGDHSYGRITNSPSSTSDYGSQEDSVSGTQQITQDSLDLPMSDKDNQGMAESFKDSRSNTMRKYASQKSSYWRGLGGWEDSLRPKPKKTEWFQIKPHHSKLHQSSRKDKQNVPVKIHKTSPPKNPDTELPKSKNVSCTDVGKSKTATPSTEARPLPTSSSSTPIEEQESLQDSDHTHEKDIGYLVWAKLGHDRWWPGLIVPGEMARMRRAEPGSNWVYWFGDHKISNIVSEKIVPFVDNFGQYFRKKTGKLYHCAVLECVKVCMKRCGIDHTESDSSILQWAVDGFPPRDTYTSQLASTFSPIPGEELPTDVLENLKKIYNRVNVSTEETRSLRRDARVSALDMVKAGQKKIEDVCIACDDSDKTVYCAHPLFEGGLCKDCKDELTETLFCYGSDGTNVYCVICGYGGELFVCDNLNCGKAYCTECMELALEVAIVTKIRKASEWQCFLCTKYSSTSHGSLHPHQDWQQRIIKLFDTGYRVTHSDLGYLSSENKHQIRVLSLFDGIGTAKLILDMLNMDVDKYYASEIDEDALLVSSVHHGSEVIQIGDVTQLDEEKLRSLCPIDLVIGGSPCNDFSLANPARKGFEYGGTGTLFFHFYRVLKTVQNFNAGRHLFWLYENVASMKSDYKKEMSIFLECGPALWDSKYFSPQSRARYFWGNIPGMYSTPELSEQYWSNFNLDNMLSPHCNRKATVNRIRTVTTRTNSLRQGKKEDLLPVLMNGKEDNIWISELERVFGFPPHYTDVGNLPPTRRQRLLGKSWSVPVVQHILSPLAQYFAVRNGTDTSTESQEGE